MYLNQCSLCKHANPATARFCNGCGVGLVCACLHCGVISDAGSRACRSCGAILPDSDALPAALPEASEPQPISTRPLKSALFDPMAPPDVAVADRSESAESVELTLNLRRIDTPPLLPAHDAVPATELIRSDPDAFVPPPIAQAPRLPEPLVGASINPIGNGRRDRPAAPASGTNKKSVRRAWVRRARLANMASAVHSARTTIDVLVLDEEAGARRQLCSLLEAFGFCPVPAQSLAEAAELAATRPFAAAFLDIVLDGTHHGAGLDLCQRVKDVSEAACGRAAAVIVTSGHVKAVDRVRASLAGGDAFLVKPLGRGDVARALDACEVALPSDARRG